MARPYALCANGTNTASATLPLVTLISTASIRPKLVAIEMGSDAAPNDNAGKYVIQRCTATGTPGSSPTPQGLDPADPQPPGTTAGLSVFSVGPTLTANAFLHQWAQNQRQAYRWWPFDYTKALVMPATSGNGLAIMPISATASAVNMVFTLSFEE
jgi:hypothetical protein